MTSFLKGQNRLITVCHGSSRPGMLGSWDFMVLSSDNDTAIVYTFQVPQSVIRQETFPDKEGIVHYFYYVSSTLYEPKRKLNLFDILIWSFVDTCI